MGDICLEAEPTIKLKAPLNAVFRHLILDLNKYGNDLEYSAITILFIPSTKYKHINHNVRNAIESSQNV
jgi:hypothetical protein